MGWNEISGEPIDCFGTSSAILLSSIPFHSIPCSSFKGDYDTAFHGLRCGHTLMAHHRQACMLARSSPFSLMEGRHACPLDPRYPILLVAVDPGLSVT